MKLSEDIKDLTVEQYGLNDKIVNDSSNACYKCGEPVEPTATICPKCKTEMIYSKYISLKREIKNYNRKIHRMWIFFLASFLVFGAYYVLAMNGCLKYIGIRTKNTVIISYPIWILAAVEGLIGIAYKKTLYSIERRIVTLVNEIKESINEYIKKTNYRENE